MALVKSGGVQIWNGRVEKTPWWFSLVTNLSSKIDNILEAASYDKDKLPAPKDTWLDDDALKSWYEEREELRKPASLDEGY